MRRRLIAGNWKMNLDWNEAMSLIADVVHEEQRSDWSKVDVAIIPPILYTRHAFEFLRNAKSSMHVGAQDCASNENGAFTGEVSASMLQSAGVSMVLVGHSERRAYFGETGEVLYSKLKCALKANLTPILCCGERIEDRNAGQAFEEVLAQLKETLFQLNADEASKVIIAYEPVWAIGTGETATPAQAQEMHLFIRGAVAKTFDQNLANECRILYGGSMKPANAAELMQQPDVDGGLIGGASLSVEQFTSIIQA